jgi:galactitol-specific phosphotransferase system IIC component
MNETLSSLIAFVGFLIVFSMLVQAVQEALKNLFKLKTGI